MDTQVVGVSVDHVPALKAWAESLGGIDYPLASDFWPHGEAARAWGVLREDDGRTERAVFIVDRKGVVRYADVHDIDDQPSNEDLFAVLKDLAPHLALRTRVKEVSATRKAAADVDEAEKAAEAAEAAIAAEVLAKESMADVEAVAEALDSQEAIAEVPAGTVLAEEELVSELEPAEGEPVVEPEPEEPPAAEPEPEETALLMYCTPWCPDCKQAREWLEAHNIPYREVDVSRDLGARTRAASHNEGRLHTPTFEVGEEICVDFRPDRLSELLEIDR